MFAYVNGADLGVIRFNAQGTIDAHGPYTTPELNAPVLDDAVAFDDALVTVWSEQTGTSWAVRAAHHQPLGRRRAAALDTFDGPSRPLVSATRSFGGAAITWIQGAGTAARVRYAVVQTRRDRALTTTDLVAAPNAEGRVVTTAEGRELLFAARDSIAGRAGVAYGRGCLP